MAITFWKEEPVPYKIKPKLCIVSPWNYPLFNPENNGHFGGWEVRVALIARELARRGNLRVSMVVGDHGQPHIEEIEGIRFHTWQGRQIWGIPFPAVPVNHASLWQTWTASAKRLAGTINSFLPNRQPRPPLECGKIGPYEIHPAMIAVYDEVDADVYTVPGNSQFSGELAWYCRQRRRQYVFLSGSDMDFYPEYKTDPEKLDIYSVPYGLKVYAIESARAHIVQNQRQADMLRDGYSRSAIVIPNPIDVTQKFQKNPQPSAILWVGKSDERVKRPSLMLELARRLPQYQFTIIMNRALEDTHQSCLALAAELSNVTITEKVPFSRIEAFFADARLHLNTSSFEGFPNTFLQAAKYGVPTVSLQVDPGSMLSQHGCGLTCEGDFERFKQSVKLLMEDVDLYTEKCKNSLNYVHEYHHKDKIIPRYEKVFTDVFESKKHP